MHVKKLDYQDAVQLRRLRRTVKGILDALDDLRDVQAAHAAGMRAIAVLYGYHGVDNGGPATWNADAVIAQPADLVAHL